MIKSFDVSYSTNEDFVWVNYQDEYGVSYYRICDLEGLKLSEQDPIVANIYDSLLQNESEMWFWSDLEEYGKEETIVLLSELQKKTGMVGFFDLINDDIAVYPLFVCLFADDRNVGKK